MLDQLLTVISQEPPTPILDGMPDILLSPIILIPIAIVIVGVIAWRYKAYLEFAAIICSTIGGFIIGLILTPPYANIGLAMMASFAALFTSTALVCILKLAKR